VDHHDPEVEDKVKSIIKKFYPKTLGEGRLRSRKSGHLTAIDLELITCRFETFQTIHEIVHDVEEGLHKEIQNVDFSSFG
jgi:divalent metal cation (Fe/Co/Zn/Cd) transporter